MVQFPVELNKWSNMSHSLLLWSMHTLQQILQFYFTELKLENMIKGSISLIKNKLHDAKRLDWKLLTETKQQPIKATNRLQIRVGLAKKSSGIYNSMQKIS